MPSIYLAGPDVFAPNPLEIGRRKKEICERHGLVGIFPMERVTLDMTMSKREQGLVVYDVMEETMSECDAIIVNMTPYHGPSMDAGSAFEMGFMRALKKPIFAYSNTASLFADRVVAYWEGKVTPRGNGEREGADGMALEEFDMVDNLMLDGSVRRSTNIITATTIAPHEVYSSLTNFEACVERAAGWLLGR
jgi:nucleoside 2-deoxyribosyltransferase